MDVALADSGLECGRDLKHQIRDHRAVRGGVETFALARNHVGRQCMNVIDEIGGDIDRSLLASSTFSTSAGRLEIPRDVSHFLSTSKLPLIGNQTREIHVATREFGKIRD